MPTITDSIVRPLPVTPLPPLPPIGPLQLQFRHRTISSVSDELDNVMFRGTGRVSIIPT
jgi:hypothetical protein